MSTRGSTAEKRQRERAKQAKAAEKRERRQHRSNDIDATSAGGDGDGRTIGQLLAEIDSLQARFGKGTIPFEEFDEQKSELLDRMAVKLASDAS